MDTRLAIVLLPFLAAVSWALFNIGRLALQQLKQMGVDKSTEALINNMKEQGGASKLAHAMVVHGQVKKEDQQKLEQSMSNMFNNPICAKREI